MDPFGLPRVEVIKTELKVHGVAELEAALAKLPGEIAERHLAASVRAAANVVRDYAQVDVPVRSDGLLKKIGAAVGATHARRPGFLRANIVARRVRRADRSAVAFAVGPASRAFYGMFLELGTRFMAARPWLRPSFDRSHEVAIKELREDLAPRIERAFKRLYRKPRGAK